MSKDDNIAPTCSCGGSYRTSLSRVEVKTKLKMIKSGESMVEWHPSVEGRVRDRCRTHSHFRERDDLGRELECDLDVFPSSRSSALLDRFVSRTARHSALLCLHNNRRPPRNVGLTYPLVAEYHELGMIDEYVAQTLDRW